LLPPLPSEANFKIKNNRSALSTSVNVFTFYPLPSV
jgi:hypothetical protein